MKNEIIPLLVITVRLQKLCDRLRGDAVKFYKKHNAGFMNKWYPVFIAFDEAGEYTVTGLAIRLGYAHTSVLQTVNEMEERKLIKSVVHKKDNRKRVLQLTTKGAALKEKILPFATAMAEALQEITDTKNNIYLALNEIEAKLNSESFLNKSERKLKK